LSSIPSNAIITSAVLKLKGSSHTGNNATYLDIITQNWYEDSVTWANQPATTSSGRISLPSPSSSTENLQLDVTQAVQQWVSGIKNNNGWLLKLQNEAGSDGRLRYFSSDYSDTTKHPVLEVEYTVPHLQWSPGPYASLVPPFDTTGEPTAQTSYVYDRFGNKYTFDEIAIPNLNQQTREPNFIRAGIFRLFFEEETDPPNQGFSTNHIDGQTRRDVLIQVCEDLSQLLVGDYDDWHNPYPGLDYNCPTGDEEFPECRYVNISVGSTKSGAIDLLGMGTPYYHYDTESGIYYGAIWDYINSGYDPFAIVSSPPTAQADMFHGKLEFNFDNFSVPVEFHYELATPCPNDGVTVDTYTVMLHEMLHNLGIITLINNNTGASAIETGAYSLWDAHLYSGASPLINFNLDNDCYSSAYSGVPFLGDCSTVDINFKYESSGIELEKIFTQSTPAQSSNLIHFNCATSTAGYVMNTNTNFGFMQRTPHLNEVRALCALGYNISGVYGNGDFTLSTRDYTIEDYCPDQRLVAGTNDILHYTDDNTGAPLTVTEYQCIDIPVSEIIANDFNTSAICCVEMVYPDLDNLSSSTGDLSFIDDGEFITYCSPHYTGYVVIKYRPVNALGQRGNITYIFVKVTNEPLDPCPEDGCNYTCYGDFENYEYWFHPFPITASLGYFNGINALFPSNDFMLWSGSANNSPDLFMEEDGNKYGHIGNQPNLAEGIYWTLSQPLQSGVTYKITYKVAKTTTETTILRVYGLETPPCNSESGTPIFTNNTMEDFGTCFDDEPELLYQKEIYNPFGIYYTDVFWYNNELSPPTFTPNSDNITSVLIHLYTPTPHLCSGLLLDDFKIEKVNNNSLEITNQTISNPNPCPNETVTIEYSLCYQTMPATNVTVSYNPPTGIDFVSLNGVSTPSVVIEPSDWVSGCFDIELVLTLNAYAQPGQAINNYINIDVTDACVDYAIPENTATLVPYADNALSISKTTDYISGNEVNYLVTVSNNSSYVISDIVVEDEIPTGLVFGTNTDFTNLGGTATTNSFILLPGEVRELTLNTTVNPSTSCGTVISNCAEISQATGTCTLPISSCVQITAQNTDMTASISTTESSCGDCIGSATVTVNNGSAPYSYLWSNSQTTQTATGLCQGICEVTVTDNNNCQTYAEGYIGSNTATTNWPFKTDQTAGTAKINDMTTDEAGNVYITGYFTGTVGFGINNLTSQGMEDVFYAKLDECGNVEWANQFGSIETDAGTGIFVDNTGNIFVSGYFSDPIIEFDYYPVSASGYDINSGILAKFDSSGDLIWKARTEGRLPISEVMIYDVKTDAQNNVYICGEYKGGRLFVYDAVGNAGCVGYYPTNYFTKPYVIKFSSDGIYQWSQKANTSYYSYLAQYNDYCRALDITENGLFVGIQRQTASAGLFTRLYYYNFDGALLSFSDNLSASGKVILNDVSVAPILGTPTVYATGNKLTALGNSNAVVYKFSGTTQEWMKIDNAFSAHIQSNGAAADNNGNVLIGGGFDDDDYNFTGVPDLVLDADEIENPFVYKFNSAGNPVWGDELNGDGEARINAVTYSQGNIFYVAGYYTDELYFDDYSPEITLTTTSAPNAFVARIVDDGSTGDYRNAPANVERPAFEETIIVYPNPAKEIVNIDFMLAEKQLVEINLTDITGRKIYNNIVEMEPVGSTSINTSVLTTGVYFISIKTKQGLITKSLMIN
jgi:hypothetical protein